MERLEREHQAALADLVFSADCQSWYKDDGGRITNNWAHDTHEYVRRTRRVDLRDYELLPHWPPRARPLT